MPFPVAPILFLHARKRLYVGLLAGTFKQNAYFVKIWSKLSACKLEDQVNQEFFLLKQDRKFCVLSFQIVAVSRSCIKFFRSDIVLKL